MTSYEEIKQFFIEEGRIPSELLTLEELRDTLKESFEDEKNEGCYTAALSSFYSEFQDALTEAIQISEEESITLTY